MNYKNSIRRRFRTSMVVVVLSTIIITLLLLSTEVWKMTQTVSMEYARLYTSELVGSLESHLQREIALTVKASKTNAILEWMNAESNADLKQKAFLEFWQFNRVFNDHNSFVAIDDSKNIYFTSNQSSLFSFAPNGVLSRDMPEDIWYFKTLDGDVPYGLNIDVDRFLNTMRVWINVKVVDHGKSIGVVGTGLYLDPFVKELFSKHHEKGAKSVIINEFGTIQMDSDLTNIKQNSFAPEKGPQKTIFQYSHDLKFTELIQNYLSNPKAKVILNSNNSDYQYMALAPIKDTRWHVVTFFSTSALYTPAKFIPLLLVILVATVILTYLINLLVNKILVEPFELLNKSIQLKDASLDQKIYGLERTDEFGVLAHTIQQMTDRLIQSVPVGMFLLDKNGHYLYGNPYFLNQFACESQELFHELMNQHPESFFAHKSNYMQLLDAFRSKPDVYVFEAEFLNSAGKPFWAEIRLTKVPHDPSGWQYEGILINTQSKKDYEQKLVVMATIDQLTGITNRHHFEQIVTDEISRCDRYGGPLSMIFFDLDHFKQVNDTWGHDVGDLVLIQTAQISKGCLRNLDTLVRWGGEEFAIILPATRLAGAVQVAEKIRTLLESHTNVTAGVVTASFGVAQRVSNESFVDWFKRADQALFKAKGTGRNKVVASEFEEKIPSAFIRLHWLKEFESGHPIIDDQHKALFDLANTLMSDASNYHNHDLETADFKTIVAHITRHLHDEIQILKSLDYPSADLEHHIEEHNRLLLRMSDLSRQFEERQLRVADLCLILIHEVIIEHMIKEDAKFFAFTSSSEIMP